jgi:hypothetical protein
MDKTARPKNQSKYPDIARTTRASPALKHFADRSACLATRASGMVAA